MGANHPDVAKQYTNLAILCSHLGKYEEVCVWEGGGVVVCVWEGGGVCVCVGGCACVCIRAYVSVIHCVVF